MEINTQEEVKKRTLFTNKRNIFILIGLLLFIVIVVSVVSINNAKHEKEEYSKQMNSAVTTMLESGTKAEKIGNQYAEAWSKAISGVYVLNGERYSDFNNAISAVSKYNKSYISEIWVSEEEVDATMKKLQNPPKEFEDAYNELTELYKVYKKYVDLCTTPKGSLITYNSTRNELSSDFVSLKDSVELKIPDIK
ncbi:hypothetical protein [Ectobacillus panaciterrae]|uniref:hypothetical protein n=1 Tax=Ectobacillus panaciterrae TaxID=363872 RepID=UPI000404220F|nr:hypothetical protein [Ectobacillus panaciterrae]